ncbi:MAG: TetR/AcrR family transcriptional regulator [Actinomycetota bacterium]|nr:TetR/AcrR family transcriptional regulator [Actinomycetota bacterium]MDA2972063.1 TetR/AcrR family transcriptional regulator [Actinomycetota bacterium]MDA3002339.1 TetR/AcrR family transcriptional regulator [Actinomycetota bacterium]
MGEQLRKRSDGLATIQVVLRHARAEMESSGPVKFNLDRVIESSGVARSSVYHHFGSRAGLVATLELEHWVESQASELRGMRKFLLEASDVNEVLAAVEFALKIDGDRAGRERRLRRITSLVAADGIPALATTLREQQVRGTNHLAETLRMMSDRGVISPELDLVAIAYFIQSNLVGRVLVDVGDEPGVDDKWVDVVVSTLRYLLSPKG